MALRPPSAVGADIAAAVKAVRPTDGIPVTDSQLAAMWTAAYEVIYNELTQNLEIQPGTFEVGHAPVSGVGGPGQ